uniref:Uncharacterized protein n=1 Tax=Arion vulgaris TaxID=1028688 RepID=A0A0B7B3J8_9EUPU
MKCEYQCKTKKKAIALEINIACFKDLEISNKCVVYNIIRICFLDTADQFLRTPLVEVAEDGEKSCSDGFFVTGNDQSVQFM